MNFTTSQIDSLRMADEIISDIVNHTETVMEDTVESIKIVRRLDGSFVRCEIITRHYP